MSRGLVCRVSAGLLAVALLLPVTSQAGGGKDAKATAKTSMVFQNPVTLAGKPIKPGNYEIAADETKVSISQFGKVVAEAPVQWKDDTSKSEYSNIVTDGGSIKEIHFGGKARYAVIS